MSEENQLLDRRAFLTRAAMLGATALGAGALLSGCDKKQAAGGGGGGAAPTPTPKKAAAPACEDVSALSDADKATRKSMAYVGKSAKADQNCANCALFKAGSPCGSCTVVKGPIDAKGWCKVWAKKPA